MKGNIINGIYEYYSMFKNYSNNCNLLCLVCALSKYNIRINTNPLGLVESNLSKI